MGKSLLCSSGSSFSLLWVLEHLCEYFAQFGTVENATVKCDKSGRSKGFGFVLFEDRDSTDKVRRFICTSHAPRRDDLGLFARSSHHSRQTGRYEIGSSSRSSVGSQSVRRGFGSGSVGHGITRLFFSIRKSSSRFSLARRQNDRSMIVVL